MIFFDKFHLNILYANSEDPNQIPDLGLHCLHLPTKKTTDLYGLNDCNAVVVEK